MKKAYGEYIIVDPIKDEEVTKSGIIVSTSVHEEPPVKGTVISKGMLIKEDIPEGSTLVYKKGMGFEIIDEDKKLLAIHYRDAICRL